MYAPVPASDSVALTNLGVVVGKVSKYLSLENFYKANVDNLPKAFDDYVEISRGTGGVPNIPSHWILFTRTLKTNAGEIKLEELQYYLIVGEYGYVITFSATPDEYIANRVFLRKLLTPSK